MWLQNRSISKPILVMLRKLNMLIMFGLVKITLSSYSSPISLNKLIRFFKEPLLMSFEISFNKASLLILKLK